LALDRARARTIAGPCFGISGQLLAANASPLAERARP
jgi:hypothetical protein